MTAMQLPTACMRTGWVLLFAAAFPFWAPSTHAQSTATPAAALETSGVDNSSGFVDTTGMDEVKDRMMRHMARQRDELRQKAIVDDTNQLLDLAQQLKTAVDKTDKDRLSLSVIRTAAQIEKLAKAVEKKMRDGD